MDLKRLLSVLIIFIGSISSTIGQEVIFESNYTIRDFIIHGDTIVISNESDIEIYKNKNLIHKYYAGGHILRIDYHKKNQIISIANKYKKHKGSIRIYDILENKLKRVYTFDKSPILDYQFIDNQKIIVSFNNGELITFETKRIKLDKRYNSNDKIRKIKIIDDSIMACSDNGTVMRIYNEEFDILVPSHRNDKLISFTDTDFGIIAISDKGELFKYFKKDATRNKITNTILTDIVSINKKLIAVSSWSGTIYIINPKNLSVIKTIKAHDGIIVKLRVFGGNLYSSSFDRTIKKWNIYK